MKIKKLELVGFKSFKDRTVIHFDNGITGVVGPNGCGKSNIVDALIWVMGEMSAKHLRGSSMEDVIFAGAEGYAPMGMAEVSLTLENDGGPFPVQYSRMSEIMVTRRLHRSGESEYLINKEQARLRDIQEIFMDTGAGAKGFSIIQQNAIGQLITAKPEDRKSLIEEAAGITKFKVRKRESERKLDSTEQNLSRLNDIVGELKRQLESLERQAQKAEKYRTLKRELEDIDLQLAATQFNETHQKVSTLQVSVTELSDRENMLQSEVANSGAETETLRTQRLEIEKELSDKSHTEQRLQIEVRELERVLQELRFQAEQARRDKEIKGSLMAENQVRREVVAEDLEKVREQLGNILLVLETTETEFIQKKELFDNKVNREAELEEKLTYSRRELLATTQAESHVSGRLQSLRESSAQLAERNENAQSVLTELYEKRVEFEGRRKKVWTNLERERQEHLNLTADVKTFEANRDILKADVEKRKAEVDAFKDQLNEVASRLYGLENLAANFEGFEVGVKSVMQWQREKLDVLPEEERGLKQEFYPIAEIVEVPQAFEVAMEAVLGPRLQMLIATSSDSAMNAVDFLKNQKNGRSSFAAGVDGMLVEVQEERPLAVRAVLTDVIRAPEKFKPSIDRLLGKAAVVDNLEEAIKFRSRYPQWTFVTVDGDVVDRDGVITGGSVESADSGVLQRRREIKELSIKREEYSGKLALAQTSLKSHEEKLNRLFTDFEAAQKRAVEKEVLLAELRKDLERAEQEFENANQASSKQEREVAQLTEQYQTKLQELETLEAKIKELEVKKAEYHKIIEESESELENYKISFQDLQTEVTRLEIIVATKRSEYESIRSQEQIMSRQLAEIDAYLERMQSESSVSSETITQAEYEMAHKKAQLDQGIEHVGQLSRTTSELRNKFEELSAQIRIIDEGLSGKQKELNELLQKRSQAQLELNQIEFNQKFLIEQIRERYTLELETILPSIYEKWLTQPFEREGAEGRIKELRERLNRMGDVNLAAINEFDEVTQRHKFLFDQQQDLIQAKEQLRKVIERINKICSKRFKETFEQVNERFTKVFPALFGGGEARLVLIEDQESGEMGIDIVAKPPGKKLQSVSLLSGGEKALTAVSLIFSIFLVKPSPYCLLDEVDAPLDDANVYRFNDLVKEMAKRSQIIVVTHNKYTMEVASKLYGVTMEERGVSKMVSVNLN